MSRPSTRPEAKHAELAALEAARAPYEPIAAFIREAITLLAKQRRVGA